MCRVTSNPTMSLLPLKHRVPYSVRWLVTAASEPESVPQQLAESPSAPAPVEGGSGESGSGSSLLAGAPECPRRPCGPSWRIDGFPANDIIRNTPVPVYTAKTSSVRQWRPRWFAAAGHRCCRRASDVVRRPAPVDAAATADAGKPYMSSSGFNDTLKIEGW